MDAEAVKVDKKVHFRDWSSREIIFTYKRRRLQKQEAQAKEEPMPQQQLQPQPHAQVQTEQKHKAEDAQAQESEDNFWKSKDMGWKYGIMIDENRQHWKCIYCGLIRFGGGVSRLKRHLAGDLDVKMCPKVPENVVEEIRVHLRNKRKRRRKRGAQNASNDIKIKSSSDDGIAEKNLLPANLVVPAKTGTNVLEEVTNQASMVHEDPTCPRVPLLRTKDIGWEHAVDLDGNKRRWQCKFCLLCRSGGVTTLKAHLTDESCPNVPMEISKKVSNFIQEKRAMRLLFNNFAFTIDDDQVSDSQLQEQGTLQNGHDQQPSREATHKCTIDEVANISSQCAAESNGQPIEHCDQPEERWAMDDRRMHQMTSNMHQISNKTTKNSENTKPIMEQGPQENRLFSDINEYAKQRSDHWTNCWRNVLDELMHSSDVQEGAGIWTCIHDALLYGCAQLGKVPETVELADGTVNVNTAKCQNVLMDVLRSEDFVLLCNILCQAAHKDGARTRYFDFGVIDSRMKNGNYGHEPGLFLHDLKMVWEDLKVAGQNIVELANRLSSLTEVSCTNLVEREKESGDNEVKGAVMFSSGPTNVMESNALVISTSQGDNQLHQSDPVDLDQSDPADVSNGQKGNTCNQCGKEEASGGSILTCTKCLLSYHISCTEPPFPSISTEIWYCRNCSMDKSIEDDMVLANHEPLAYCRQNCLHENCVACDRLEVCSSPKREGKPNDNSRAMALYSVGSGEDSVLSEIDKVGLCKMCGCPEKEDRRFLICGHVHCRYKYYHIRCLKSKQIASDFQRDKPCWYCPSCLCRVCHSNKDDDLTVLCDGCDEAYHLYCLTPRRTSIPKGLWYCSPCSRKRAKDGMIQYERRMLKLHRKVDTRLQRGKCDGVDLLLSAANMLSADGQRVNCTSSGAHPTG